MKAKTKVLQWIEKNFDLTKVKLKDFPVLPGGTKVIDSEGGELLVFYDFLNEKVMTGYPEDKKFKRVRS